MNKKYIRLDETNRVLEIIPEFDPVFPEIPLSERYSKVFIDSLMEIEEDVKVEQNWYYNKSTNGFVKTINEILSSSELREKAYKELAIINWESSTITVDKANELWIAYTAEGNTEKSSKLSALIAEAKASIREMYPDEVVEEPTESVE